MSDSLFKNKVYYERTLKQTSTVFNFQAGNNLSLETIRNRLIAIHNSYADIILDTADTRFITCIQRIYGLIEISRAALSITVNFEASKKIREFTLIFKENDKAEVTVEIYDL